MSFYRISELRLAKLIQRYDKKNCQMVHFMIVLIPYINVLNLSWKTMSLFSEIRSYGGFKRDPIFQDTRIGSMVPGKIKKKIKKKKKKKSYFL